MEFLKNNWKAIAGVTAALVVSVVIGKVITNNQEETEVLTSEENEA